MNSENKIDAIINEVLESKHLRKSVGFLFKMAAVGLLVFVIVLVIAVATGVIS